MSRNLDKVGKKMKTLKEKCGKRTPKRDVDDVGKRYLQLTLLDLWKYATNALR